jgi:hypothetical protein
VAADESLWGEALNTVVFPRNVTHVNIRTFEHFWGRKPRLQFLRNWGCLAYVMTQTDQATQTWSVYIKLGAQSIQGMFIGYELGSKAYRVRVGRRVYVSHDVHGTSTWC